jgi:hypothetical protein
MATNPTTQEHVFRGRGRPREFDLNEVLDKAAQVFCERGYHATSISDLTSGMELASGSVYKAFKDKRTRSTGCRVLFDCVPWRCRATWLYGDQLRRRTGHI